MEKEAKTVVIREVVFLDENLWKQIKMEEFDKDKKSNDPLNITSYPICSLGRDGEFKEIDLLSYRRQNNIYFDVTNATDEIKRQLEEAYKVEIREISVKPAQKARTMTLLPATAECYNNGALTREDKKQLGSEYVLLENRENGFKISKCIMFNGYIDEIDGQIFLSVNLSSLSPELRDKIIGSIETFVPNKHGYYDWVNQNEDVKEVDKSL